MSSPNIRNSFFNVNASGTIVLLRNGGVALHSITINNAGASGIAVYDQVLASGIVGKPLIATISSSAPAGSTFLYDVQLSNGLTVVVGGNQDITLSVG